MPRHVRAGDTVIVTSGDHKGQTGEVVRVLGERVLVKGINMRTKHVKPTRLSPQGGVVQRESPIHISKVSPVVDGKPTRVRFECGADGKKKRIAVRTGQPIATSARKRKGEKVRTDTL
ncbi:MAG: 50S ribosomal protein L24 [Leptolyngbya sp. PLA3]|nr:MAG: 50S ribosomal protein L24 [Cyanobacteria bacterium CYA]MCE7969095.1 50S ribosomal protein L24 [Leptolyngbya sp. PL-A3]